MTEATMTFPYSAQEAFNIMVVRYGGMEELLDALQNVHDAHPPEVWEDKLEEIAWRFDLRYTP